MSVSRTKRVQFDKSNTPIRRMAIEMLDQYKSIIFKTETVFRNGQRV